VNGGHLQTFCQQVSARGETKGLTATSATAGPNLRSLAARARARSRRLSA